MYGPTKQVSKDDFSNNNNSQEKTFSSSSYCGYVSRVQCVDKNCRCVDGWIGIHLRAYDGYEDIDWYIERSLSFHIPSSTTLNVSFALGGIWMLFLLVHVWYGSKKG